MPVKSLPREPHEEFCDCYIYEVRRAGWNYAYCYGACVKRDFDNGGYLSKH